MATSTIFRTDYTYTPEIKDCVIPSHVETTSTTHVLNIPTASRNMIIFGGNSNSRTWIGYIYCTNTGSVSTDEIYKGSAISSVSTATNKITVTLSTASSAYIRIINVYGDVPYI